MPDGLPSLYSITRRGDTIAAIGRGAAPESLCDGQWLLFPDAIACLPKDGRCFTFTSATRFRWIADQYYDTGAAEYGSVPEAIRGSACTRPIYLFVPAGGGHVRYLGRLTACYSCGIEHGLQYGLSDHDLQPPLPSDIWQAVGGYPCQTGDSPALDDLPVSLSVAATPEARFELLRALVEAWYGPVSKADGIPEERLARLDLPEPLRRWYALGGARHGLVDGQNVLLGPREVRRDGPLAVFYGENQWVAEWAWRGDAADPEVWCNCDGEGWKQDGCTLSEFLILAFLFEAAAQAPYGGSISTASPQLFEAVTQQMSPLVPRWRHWPPEGGTTFYARNGALALVAGPPDGPSIFFGARTEHPLAFLKNFVDESWEVAAL
jgi:hypothetical protein